MDTPPPAAPPTFDDIFLQTVDLRWCLLVRCDYSSLTALRKVSSAFVHDVPVALNSEEWCAFLANSVALHAAQWTAGGADVHHKPLSQPVGKTVIRLQCADDSAREVALANGAVRDEAGEPIIVVHHPIGVERMLNAAQLAAMAPPMAPFLRDPLVHTTTMIPGATHNNGAVYTVSTAPDAIPRSGQGPAALPARVRACRSRHLVASGGSDGISRVSCVTPTARADSLLAAPLSVQGALRHGSELSAVEVLPSGVLLTACGRSTTLRVYELEAAHLAAERIAAAGMPRPTRAPATASRDEWNYVERARLQDRNAQHSVVAAKWLDDRTLVEVGFAHDGEDDDSAPQRVLRTWRVGASHRAAVVCADDTLPGSVGDFTALAAGDRLVVVAHNPPNGRPGYADVYRAVTAADADAPPALVPVRRLQEHTEPLYACAVGGGLLATGGDDCTVRLWSAAALLPSDSDDDRPPTADVLQRAPASLQTLQLPGKVWALALHSHLLVVGGALASEADGMDGQIRVRLVSVADLANGHGPAVVLRTLQVPSIASRWGVRSVATHGGTAVVAGGDDGIVHVWALAETGKADRGDVAEGEPAAA